MMMSTEKNLIEHACLPCQGGVVAFDVEQASEYMSQLNEAWCINQDNDAGTDQISRAIKFKNFAKTMFFVNALANLADQEGHHPDVAFGYNYCEVSFTTHEAGGLTINDFICARKVDSLLS